MRIYTRTGDQGETGLFGGQRLSKSHPRVAAYGEVDELNAHLGLCASLCADPDLSVLLARIQSDLFVLGGDVAFPRDDGDPASEALASRVPRVTEGMAAYLESEIDRLELELEPLRNFILPGGTELASRMHLARAVCRRAERAVVGASGREVVNPDGVVYLNRLSDLLFVLARVVNRRAGQVETVWMPTP